MTEMVKSGSMSGERKRSCSPQLLKPRRSPTLLSHLTKIASSGQGSRLEKLAARAPITIKR